MGYFFKIYLEELKMLCYDRGILAFLRNIVYSMLLPCKALRLFLKCGWRKVLSARFSMNTGNSLRLLEAAGGEDLRSNRSYLFRLVVILFEGVVSIDLGLQRST